MMNILELLELQILAAARGIEAYYGIPPVQTYEKEEIYYAVHQLLKAGILEKEDDGLKIQPPISKYLDWMTAGKWVLVVDLKGMPYPRQCLYLSEAGCLCLEASTTDKSKVFLYEISPGELAEEWGNTGQLPEEKLREEIGAFDFPPYWEKHLRIETMTMLQKGCQATSEELLECPQIYSIFSLHDKTTGTLQARLVLLDLPLEYCMVIQKSEALENEPEICWVPYKKEQALKEINRWWRENL